MEIVFGLNPVLPTSAGVFVGREAGRLARENLGLDKADAERINTTVHIPGNTLISSSYFTGLFARSVVACGSRESFLRRFQFNAPEHCWHSIINPCIQRALFEGEFATPGGAAFKHTIKNPKRGFLRADPLMAGILIIGFIGFIGFIGGMAAMWLLASCRG